MIADGTSDGVVENILDGASDGTVDGTSDSNATGAGSTTGAATGDGAVVTVGAVGVPSKLEQPHNSCNSTRTLACAQSASGIKPFNPNMNN